MQFKFFTIPACAGEEEERLLNNFLASHRVLESTTYFNPSPNGATWHICVKYLVTKTNERKSGKNKTDYKEVLNPAHFEIFTKLRAIRKDIAVHDAIPAYAVFTDEELAAISQLPEITPKGVLSVKSIGEKKAEKFGTRLINMYTQTGNNEKSQ